MRISILDSKQKLARITTPKPKPIPEIIRNFYVQHLCGIITQMQSHPILFVFVLNYLIKKDLVNAPLSTLLENGSLFRRPTRSFVDKIKMPFLVRNSHFWQAIK